MWKLKQSSQYSDWVTSWMVKGSNPSKGKKFIYSPKPPDQLWGLPSLLFSGYQRLIL
jgi:hypothetical protein